ncbi:MAG: isochorismatase family protein [Prevotellaceae bacterium]|jgi:nicotinamidase-related amidase|nr:isochorismatase family protein [Prevotellaceae bacterium]
MKFIGNSNPNNQQPRTHIVVDVLNDFIVGSMVCLHAQEAVIKIIEHINAHPEDEVLYVCDAHPANHYSFETHGGIWPVHCVKSSFGQAIDISFYTRLLRPRHRPRISENVFEKGTHPELEEYSGYLARCKTGKTLKERLIHGQAILVSGIATEYCVLETVKDLLQDGHPIEILTDGLGYVTFEGHREALAKMGEKGVVMC